MLETIGGMNWALIFGVLFAVSEGLDAIPSIAASSIWKSIYNFLKMLKGFFIKPPAA